MSKPVRLPDYLHAEVERLAALEKRSLANMVQVLLEQALTMERSRVVVTDKPEQEIGAMIGASDHFRPDFKKERK